MRELDFEQTLSVIHGLLGHPVAGMLIVDGLPIGMVGGLLSRGNLTEAGDELAKVDPDAIAIGWQEARPGLWSTVILYPRFFVRAETEAGLLVIESHHFTVDLRSRAIV